MFSDENDEMNFDIRGFKQGELFFSNSVEVLFEHLKVNLFSEDSHPFSQRVLISPSSAMQQWIQMQLASSLSIAGGITPTFLNKAIEILTDRLFQSSRNQFFPSQLALFLRIEHEIDQASTLQDEIWKPLCQYLEGKQHRKISLVSHLAKQFVRYGIFANQAAHDWETKPSNWQEALWAKIFNDWDYPLRSLLNLEPRQTMPADLSVHLFACSHLSPLHFHFFCTVSHYIPVYFYHLSACQEFWSGLDESTPPLLENLGKVGRAMARQIEESDLLTEESYLEFGGETQLKQLQRDMLHMQQTDQVLDDDSIQVHLSTTPYREIENLYAHLTNLMAQSELEPKDVLVMAPNITLYAPYIQHVFGKALDYQIADLPMQTALPPVQGLFLLLDLEKKRWNAPAVLELFDHSLFRQKHRFSQEDLLQIRSWVQKTSIRWGVDSEHRDQLLKKSHCHKGVHDAGGTWINGLGHLIEELALSHDSPRIDFTQAELLGDLVALLMHVQTDLQQLNKEQTLNEWVFYFKKLLETYFVHSEDTLRLFTKLDKMVKAAEHIPEKKYAFTCVYSLLKESIGNESATIHRNRLQAVRFCSMLPMRAIPAKVICLIGMNHDAFPRKDELKNLDLLRENPKCDYSPSRLDFDRYLFLEALLSAREKLRISYLGHDPYDLTELPPSSVIAELLPFISKNQIIKHPPYMLEEAIASVKPLFSIRTKENFSLPAGKFVVDVSDLVRLTRSSLQHYLFSHELKIREEESIKSEEDFILSPLKRALLYRQGLYTSQEDFPIGMFKTVAEEQLKELLAESVSAELTKVHIPPTELTLSSACSISLVGSIEGVFEKGLCITQKCDLKGAVRAWPTFLVLKLLDATKETLLFAHSQTEKKAFFEDSKPYLRQLLTYYFFSKNNPTPLLADWVEPILQQDAKKLKNLTLYDPAMRWYLRGKQPLSAEKVISNWYPWVEKLYGEMSHAWF